MLSKLFRATTLAFALAGLVATGGLVGHYFAGGSSPAPTPDPMKALTKAGREYAAPLVKAKATSLRAFGDAILAGKTFFEAQAADESTFKAERTKSFDVKVKAAFNAVVPDNADLKDPALKQAAAEAAYAMAFGLDPSGPLKPRGPPAGDLKLEGQAPVGDLPGNFTVPGVSAKFGWVDRPAERSVMADRLPARTLSLAAPDMVGGAEPDAVFLYKAYDDVLGGAPHYPAQQTGDCTSFGTAHAIDLGQLVEIAIAGGDKGQYRETSSEVIYGIGREIAGMLRSGGGANGCYGVAVAKAVTDFGTLPREVVGPYTGERAKSFGYYGVPADLKEKAKAYKVGGATLVTTQAEAKSALANGYPFIVCSNQGFTLRRDADGVCQPSGHWPHCMFVSAYRPRNGRLQFCIENSWGDQLPSGPKTDGQPDYSFWAEGSVLARMLAANDSLAFSKFPQFVKRGVPARWTWSAIAEPPPVVSPANDETHRSASVLPFRRQVMPASFLTPRRKAG